ncbi:MFS transporter [Pseudomassariella vexata]|uniref:MFS transporter n=1 Tax=Pseudomassariella vexata TaxID=1141098 RepID=A0A1Y2EJF2_9PEZI|nr:MFS transporter [Pseudomassariella vexata]ORY71693.1 MFS transporter [Pseudomassariella vexata]
MSTSQTVVETVQLEPQPVSRNGRIASPSEAVAESTGTAGRESSLPVFKVLVAGFSFFCAGLNDGTLGPLIPYIRSTFHTGTGEVAIIYAATFAGWLLAAVTNLILAAHFTLGQLLMTGAILQLLSQSLRPWCPLPVFCLSFFLQALGMAYQDAHSNTFVSSIKNVPHRWLGFIHASYALGTLVGPLIATGIANMQSSTTDEVWRRSYFVLIGIGLLNVAGVAAAFRDCGEDNRSAHRKNKVAFQDIGELLRTKTLWLLSLFYFFELGAALTTGGWVVEFLYTVRGGDLSKMGYVPAGYAAGLLLGRLLLAEPTFRFGEQRMLLVYSTICVGLQLVFWLQPNIVASATALSLMGFFFGPFFATGMSVASKIFPKKHQSAAIGLIFVLAQAGGAIFPSITGLIATSQAGVGVLQPVVLALIIAGGVCWWLVPKVPDHRD